MKSFAFHFWFDPSCFMLYFVGCRRIFFSSLGCARVENRSTVSSRVLLSYVFESPSFNGPQLSDASWHVYFGFCFKILYIQNFCVHILYLIKKQLRIVLFLAHKKVFAKSCQEAIKILKKRCDGKFIFLQYLFYLLILYYA